MKIAQLVRRTSDQTQAPPARSHRPSGLRDRSWSPTVTRSSCAEDLSSSTSDERRVLSVESRALSVASLPTVERRSSSSCVCPRSVAESRATVDTRPGICSWS